MTAVCAPLYFIHCPCLYANAYGALWTMPLALFDKHSRILTSKVALRCLFSSSVSPGESQGGSQPRRSFRLVSIRTGLVLSILLLYSYTVSAKYHSPSFPACTPVPRSAEKPHNARQVRPSDVDVVMALGDSITAGFGMLSPLIVGGLREFRGRSFSIGGREKAMTMPNLLRHVRPFGSPDVLGTSMDTETPFHLLWLRGSELEPHRPKNDVLNAAQSGAIVQEMIPQVDYLIQELSNLDGPIDFQNDWKVLTFLGGANNLCRVCQKGYTNGTADAFEEAVDTILTKLQAQVPRLIVNLVPMLNISHVYDIGDSHMFCREAWHLLGECPCMSDGDDIQSNLRIMDEMKMQYWDRLEVLEAKWEAKNIEDFKVTVQPFLSGTAPADEDTLSDVDCFHPNLLAHELFAVGLWNNMLQPKGMKQLSVAPQTTEALCPSENDFIQ